MVTTPRRMTQFLRLLSPYRLRPLVCCLLTLWAAFDSPVLALTGVAISIPLSQNGAPSQDSDDDEMLDLSELMARQQTARRKVRLPSVTLSLRSAFQKPCATLILHRRFPLATLVCEHEYRNGVGA